MKDTFYHFVADVPAYLVIAWVNFAQILPNDLSQIETFFLHWGWLLLLALRLINALMDLYRRSKTNDYTIIKNGEVKNVGIWDSIIHELKSFLK
jgi:hypothetical protein